MAEGFARTKLSNIFRIYSAGVEAHGLNPKAVSVMHEIGIDISIISKYPKLFNTPTSTIGYHLVVYLVIQGFPEDFLISHLHWSLALPSLLPT